MPSTISDITHARESVRRAIARSMVGSQGITCCHCPECAAPPCSSTQMNEAAGTAAMT